MEILSGVRIEIGILTGPRGAVDRETGRDRLDGYKKEQWRGSRWCDSVGAKKSQAVGGLGFQNLSSTA
jgi:hypothetical protein